MNSKIERKILDVTVMADAYVAATKTIHRLKGEILGAIFTGPVLEVVARIDASDGQPSRQSTDDEAALAAAIKSIVSAADRGESYFPAALEFNAEFGAAWPAALRNSTEIQPDKGDSLRRAIAQSRTRQDSDRKLPGTHVAALVRRIFSRCVPEEVDRVINRVMSVHPDAGAADESFEYQMRGVGCIGVESIVNPDFSNASDQTVGDVRRLLTEALSADGMTDWPDGTAATVLAAVWAEGKPQEHEYAFDCTLTAAIRVKGVTREAAEVHLRAAMDAADCNGGSWRNGEPILFEASVNEGALYLYQVDGEDVDDVKTGEAEAVVLKSGSLSREEAEHLLSTLNFYDEEEMLNGKKMRSIHQTLVEKMTAIVEASAAQ